MPPEMVQRPLSRLPRSTGIVDSMHPKQRATPDNHAAAEAGSAATVQDLDPTRLESDLAPRFIELHRAIWDVLREEVLKGYQQQLAA